MENQTKEIQHLQEQIDELLFFIKQCNHWKNMEHLNNRVQELRQTQNDLRDRENKSLPED